jgi:hypothetical protein
VTTPPSASEQGPRYIKVDLDTPLETALTFLMIVAALVTLYIPFTAVVGLHRRIPYLRWDPTALYYLPLSIGAFLVFLYLRTRTHNYYLFDRQRREVIYHFEFLFIRKVFRYLAFGQIKAVGVHGRIRTARDSRWYEYQVQLIDEQGTLHPMSDAKELSELPSLNQRAENLARLVGCPWYPGKEEHQLIITPDSQRGEPIVSLKHVPLTPPNPASKPG